MENNSKKFFFGDQEVVLETGSIARQATGSVMITMGDSQVLATVVGLKSMKIGQKFFPLSVHYQEKTYSAGKIPGGYFKREGRPTEKETLTSRLIDRPLRPLFPEGFMNEVQVVLTVMSASKTHDTDICAMLGASAALSISGIPFDGPIGAARVGFSETGQFQLNPSFEELTDSRLDMVVAGTKEAVLMVESEADELTEDQMLGAVNFAHNQMQEAIISIFDFAQKYGKAKWEWKASENDPILIDSIKTKYEDAITNCYKVSDKQQRYLDLAELRKEALVSHADSSEEIKDSINEIINSLEKSIVRERVLSGEPRIDGRDLYTVRPIDCKVGVLKRAHGSALFTRGETQAIVVTTLGALRDAQVVDGLMSDEKDTFMLHYNFPPYCVGEAGMMSGPKRREIGHGRLARRGIYAMLPDEEVFPYTIRVVSEITESNGSSSMASVCGSSLSLMDAGVPLRAPVAGIAMGLVKDGSKFAVLTDILGDEDHLGDMDFKVAGSSEGITALQMDIKIQGITEEIMQEALIQAKQARVTILEQMNSVLSEARSEVADSAPRTYNFRIDPDKIREVIGKGGNVIRNICEVSKATVDLDDDGTVRIYAETNDYAKKAISMIESITAEAEIGSLYKGRVERIVDFGAFVNILPGKDGLVHISQISDERVESVQDHLTVGQTINVKVLDVDSRGRIKLTMKGIA